MHIEHTQLYNHLFTATCFGGTPPSSGSLCTNKTHYCIISYKSNTCYILVISAAKFIVEVEARFDFQFSFCFNELDT
jgi:hypothetical protein